MFFKKPKLEHQNKQEMPTQDLHALFTKTKKSSDFKQITLSNVSV